MFESDAPTPMRDDVAPLIEQVLWPLELDRYHYGNGTLLELAGETVRVLVGWGAPLDTVVSGTLHAVERAGTGQDLGLRLDEGRQAHVSASTAQLIAECRWWSAVGLEEDSPGQSERTMSPDVAQIVVASRLADIRLERSWPGLAELRRATEAVHGSLSADVLADVETELLDFLE